MKRSLRRWLAVGLAVPSFVWAAPAANPRNAAQSGLDFLGRNTIAWQKVNKCNGCHVQAVTLAGLAVGTHNQYVVPRSVIDEVVNGILTLPGGARTKEGLSHGSFPKTTKTFGAEAFGRYDALVDSKLADDLRKVSMELLKLQDKEGSVRGDHQSYPVTTGVMQSTFQAAQAWRQMFARTADDMWLAPLRSAEGFIARTAKGWDGNAANVYLQDVNYAVLGLVSAGASANEGDLARLLKSLEARQKEDGGWGFGQNSDPFATGQTVYALKMAGRTEDDRGVARGLGWLVAHQAKDGSWGGQGAARAEAMWAVLGLVSVDVLSVAVKGVTDGEHVLPTHQLTVDAKDNQGAEVKSVELRIDDVVVKTVKAGSLAFSWDTAALKDGKHTIDALATNAKGQVSRRRLEVFAGNVFLTQLGSRFNEEGTQVTLRNLAPETLKGQVSMRVFADDGKATAKEPLFTTSQASHPGATSFVFAGKGKDGKPFAAGRYRAVLAFADEKGKELQKDELIFVHDSAEAQRARYAEVEGKLEMQRDGDKASNALVELVDDSGRVVQQVRSNEAGQYRFKGVSTGKYKVRFGKDGFKAAEAEVDAKAGAAPASAPASFH